MSRANKKLYLLNSNSINYTIWPKDIVENDKLIMAASTAFEKEMDVLIGQLKTTTETSQQVALCRSIYAKCISYEENLFTSNYISVLLGRIDFIDSLKYVLSKENTEWDDDARSACLTLFLGLLSSVDSFPFKNDREFMAIVLEDNKHINASDGHPIVSNIEAFLKYLN